MKKLKVKPKNKLGSTQQTRKQLSAYDDYCHCCAKPISQYDPGIYCEECSTHLVWGMEGSWGSWGSWCSLHETEKAHSKMPNYCHNMLKIEGDRTELKRFAGFAKGKNRDLDFEKFVPYPQEQDIDRDIWRFNNWGTKWNAYVNFATHESGMLLYSFITARGPPKPVVTKMAEMFPSLSVELRYIVSEDDLEGVYEVKCEETPGNSPIVKVVKDESRKIERGSATCLSCEWDFTLDCPECKKNSNRLHF